MTRVHAGFAARRVERDVLADRAAEVGGAYNAPDRDRLPSGRAARPAFSSPGHWLYRNGTAVVHVSDARAKEVTHALDASQGDASKRGAKGIVDHIAFRCSG